MADDNAENGEMKYMLNKMMKREQYESMVLFVQRLCIRMRTGGHHGLNTTPVVRRLAARAIACGIIVVAIVTGLAA